MPFITQDRRDIIDESGLEALLEIAPGDICYAYYKPMVDAWRVKPRWTTAHNIYKDMLRVLSWIDNDPKGADNAAAYQLAWQVFFQLYVMPYEIQKRKENGDV